MELNLQFAGVCADLESFISARNQSTHPQVMAGAGKRHSSQHFEGSRNRSENNLKTRWMSKAGPGVALKSIKISERTGGLKAA